MIWEVGQDCRLLPVSHASTTIRERAPIQFKPAPRYRPRHAKGQALTSPWAGASGGERESKAEL